MSERDQILERDEYPRTIGRRERAREPRARVKNRRRELFFVLSQGKAQEFTTVVRSVGLACRGRTDGRVYT